MRVTTACLVLAGLAAGFFWQDLLKPLQLQIRRALSPPCLDIYAGEDQPPIYSLGDLYQHDYGRGGLSHITVAGLKHHGTSQLEAWMQSFAPGVATPIHRHTNEEVFIVLKGKGSIFSKQDEHADVLEQLFKVNTTIVVPTNVMHQIKNTGKEDVQLLVALGTPPMKAQTLATWDAKWSTATSQQPYFWDKTCPPEGPALTQA